MRTQARYFNDLDNCQQNALTSVNMLVLEALYSLLCFKIDTTKYCYYYLLNRLKVRSNTSAKYSTKEKKKNQPNRKKNSSGLSDAARIVLRCKMYGNGKGNRDKMSYYNYGHWYPVRWFMNARARARAHSKLNSSCKQKKSWLAICFFFLHHHIRFVAIPHPRTAAFVIAQHYQPHISCLGLFLFAARARCELNGRCLSHKNIWLIVAHCVFDKFLNQFRL